MSFLSRILSSSRVRAASRRLSEDPTPRAYAELAQEHASRGRLDEVERVTAEGLRLFPGDTELARLAARARSLRLEGRIRDLQQDLRDSPRPALWQEFCDLLIEAGRFARAEEVATEWNQAVPSGEAQYYCALARARRFFTDRRRDDGRLAFDLVQSVEEALPGDPRPVRLRLELASRIGAWSEVRRALARLLEYTPGDAALEARFRTVVVLSDNAKTVERALRDVERTGRFVDDEPEPEPGAATGNVRPLLQSMVDEPEVNAAFYVRGSTALVQGPKGATAERAARGVREIVGSCRAAARRLGLGTAKGATLEGDFGTLLVVTSEQSSCALWSESRVGPRQEQRLRELATSATTGEVKP